MNTPGGETRGGTEQLSLLEIKRATDVARSATAALADDLSKASYVLCEGADTDDRSKDLAFRSLAFQLFAQQSASQLLVHLRKLNDKDLDEAVRANRTKCAFLLVRRLLETPQFLHHQPLPIRATFLSIMLDVLILFSGFLAPLMCVKGVEVRKDATPYEETAIKQLLNSWSLYICTSRKHLQVFDDLPDAMSINFPAQGKAPASRRKYLSALEHAMPDMSTVASAVLLLIGYSPSESFGDVEDFATARERMRAHLSRDLYDELRWRGMSVCCFCGLYEDQLVKGNKSAYPSCSKCRIATYCSQTCQRSRESRRSDWKGINLRDGSHQIGLHAKEDISRSAKSWKYRMNVWRNKPVSIVLSLRTTLIS